MSHRPLKAILSNLFRSVLHAPRSALFAVLAAVLCLGSSASAANLYWSTNGVLGGGASNWDTSSAVWSTSVTGPFTAIWNNANNDVAIFAGNAGVVTNSTSITNGGLTFNTTGYTITNTSGSILAFGAANNTITLNGIAGATISGPVGGSGNVTLANQNPAASGTVTFNGIATGGWSGTTTINPGQNLTTTSTSTATNQVLNNTTGLTLNGGGTVQFTRNSNTGLNAINDFAPIAVNAGGTFSVTSAGGGSSAIENIGGVTVNSGLLNLVQTANNQNTIQLNSISQGGSTASLAISANSSAFTTAAFTVNGATATAANAIIGPWATVGSAATNQNDYAIYDSSGRFVNLNLAATAETTWPTATTPATTDNYTLANAAGPATQLTATRRVNTLRYSGGPVTNTASIAANVITITGSTYNNGDVLAVPTNSVITGLTRDQLYYVVNASGATFQLAATPGGTPLTVSGSGSLTPGLTLSSGNNLETYGILNGASVAFGIGGATGAGTLSTPTGGGNLFLTPGGSGANDGGIIVINAPITDNGGAVTVVKNGSGGALILSGNNTFSGGLVVNSDAGSGAASVRLSGTQSFTGGITLNGGGIGENGISGNPGTPAASLNNNPITVNGVGHLLVSSGQTLGTGTSITINSAGVLTVGGDSNGGSVTVPGVVSGSGVLDIGALNANNAAGNTTSLTNSANTFTGNVILKNSNTGTYTLNVNSLGDGGKVYLDSGGPSMTFALNTNAAAGMTFNTRQFAFMTGSTSTYKIANYSASPFTINTGLDASAATGAKTLTLGGTGAGLSTFGGVIGNGSATSVAITKVDSGTWALTSANTYSGGTTISAAGGILEADNNLALGTGMLTISATLSNNVSATLTNRINLAAAATVGVGSGQTLTLGGIITNTFGLTKTGPGTLVLTNANTYSGTTTVSAGTLLANGINSISTNTVTVGNGGALGGTGTVGGKVTVNAAGTIVPGGAGAIGTLTLTNKLTDNGYLIFDLTSPVTAGTTYDQINGGGTLTVTNPAPAIVQLNPTTGVLTNGTYYLITNAASIAGGPFVFLNGLSSQTVGASTLTLVTSSTNLILTVSADVGYTNSYLTWRGTNTVWDIGTTYNWLSGGTITNYANGKTVIFDDSASSYLVAGTNLAPGLVIFNTAGNYTNAASTNTIGGTASLVKLGSGTLYVNATNSYTGGTIINGGTVAPQLTAPHMNLGGTGANVTFSGSGTLSTVYGAVGNLGGLAISNGVTATFPSGSGSAALNFSGPVTGNGTLMELGAGGGSAMVVVLNSTSNTFTGPINLGGAATTGGNLNFSSLPDTATPTAIYMQSGGCGLNMNSTAVANVAWTNRYLQIGGTNQIISIANNNTTKTLNIYSDIQVTGSGAEIVNLYGSLGGTNVIAGQIPNGSATSLTINVDPYAAGQQTGAIWYLSNTNSSYTGQTTLGYAGASLVVNSIQNFGQNSSLGAPVSGAIVIGNNSSATLTYVGSGNTANRTIQSGDSSNGGGSSYLLNNGTGPLNFTAATFMPAVACTGARTLVLGGNYAGGINQIQGIIPNNTGGTVAITKNADASTWVLGGTNTYTGVTTVNGGTLLITGNSIAATGKVTVNGGATLGGVGIMGGTVTNLTGSTLALSDGSGNAGTLTLTNGLGLNGAFLSFILTNANTGAYSQVNIATNTFVVNGINYIKLTAATNQIPPGTYTLITNSISRVPATNQFVFYQTGATNWTIGTTTLTLTNGANSVLLNVSGSDPVALGGATSTIYWAPTNGTWDTATFNWTNRSAGPATNYADGQILNVVFDDLATIFTVTNSSAAYSPYPGSVTFNNTNHDYNLKVPIQGFGAVTKNGTGRLVFTNYLGNGLLTLNGGAVSNTVNAALSNSIINLSANMELGTASGATLTVYGAITNAGSLTKAGAGILNLSGVNTYSGNTILNGGQLTATNDYNLGASGVPLTVLSPSTVLFSGTYNRNIALSNNISFTGGGPASPTIAGQITGTGGVSASYPFGLTVNLSSLSNTFTGPLVVGAAGSTGGTTINVASLADSPSTISLSYTYNGTAPSGVFGYSANAVAPLTLSNRQFVLTATVASLAGNKISNQNTNYPISIYKNLGASNTVPQTLTLDAVAGPTNLFAGNIGDGTGSGVVSLTKTSAGTWALAGTNTYTGPNIISGGTLSLSWIDVVANANNLGKSTAAPMNLQLSGGTLKYTGGAASTDRNFALVASSAIDASGSDAVNFSQTGVVSPDQTLTANYATGQKVVTGLSSTANLSVGMRVTNSTSATAIPANTTIASIDSSTQITLNNNTAAVGTGTSLSFGYAARTLTLTGTSTATNTLAGILQDSSAAGTGTLSLTKSGLGTWVLTGANAYSGVTTVSAGTLLVNGNAIAVTNAVSVTNGATFGGTGTIGSVVRYQTNSLAAFTITAPDGSGYNNTTYMTFTNAVFMTNVTVGVSLPANLRNGTYVLATNYLTPTLSGSLSFKINSGSLGAGGSGVVSVSGNNLILTVSGVSMSLTLTNASSVATNFITTYGAACPAQVFGIVGVGLANNVTVTATNNYQVSTDNAKFSSGVTIATDVNGAVTTNLYLRLSTNAPVSPSSSYDNNTIVVAMSNLSTNITTTTGNTVNPASAQFTVTSYSAVYNGSGQTATVSAITGVNGESGGAVGAVNVSATTHTNVGSYPNDGWTFTPTANYAGSTGSVSNYISPAPTTLLLTNNPAGTNYYGQTLVFTAVVQTNGNVTAVNASSNVVFSIGTTPVWTNLVVGGLAIYTNDDMTVGVTNLTAIYSGDLNYAGSTSLTVTQRVLPTTPTLTVVCSNIVYGQALVNSLLTGSVATNGYDLDNDGDEQVAGTFTFTTLAGIVPNAGATNVSITFTPNDSTNYTTATTNVTVYVSTDGTYVTITSVPGPTNGYKDTVFFSSLVTNLATGALATDATGYVIYSYATNGATPVPFSTNNWVLGATNSLSISNQLPRGTNVIIVTYAGDLNYIGFTNMLIQTVTNHPPVAGNDSLLWAMGTENRSIIIVTDLLANDTDADGDPLTLTAVDATTANGVLLITNDTYVQYTGTLTNIDTFTYTISDGFGGESTATVTITPTNTPIAPSGLIATDGLQVTNVFFGIAGNQYEVQRTLSLLDPIIWYSISTNTMPDSGVITNIDTFSDLLPPPIPTEAYYRLIPHHY